MTTARASISSHLLLKPVSLFPAVSWVITLTHMAGHSCSISRGKAPLDGVPEGGGSQPSHRPSRSHRTSSGLPFQLARDLETLCVHFLLWLLLFKCPKMQLIPGQRSAPLVWGMSCVGRWLTNGFWPSCGYFRVSKMHVLTSVCITLKSECLRWQVPRPFPPTRREQ